MNLSRPYFEIHFAVLLAGLTGVLGEVISLSALPLVWWRVLFSALSFLPLFFWVKGRGTTDRGTALRLMGVGCLVALHWVTFYGSIKLANASIALVCLSMSSLMTASLDALFSRRRPDWLDIGAGALVIPGMLLIAGVVRTEYYAGLAVGTFSAFLVALFSVLRKRYVERARSVDIAFYEMSGATLFLTITYPLLSMVDMGESRFWPQGNDVIYLAILVLACTTLAMLLSVRALRQLSAFSCNLAYGLEPIYGVALAALLLKQYEDLHPGFYLGAILIALAVGAHPFLVKRRKKVISDLSL